MSIIALNFLYAVGGVFLMWVAYRIFDRLMPMGSEAPACASWTSKGACG